MRATVAPSSRLPLLLAAYAALLPGTASLLGPGAVDRLYSVGGIAERTAMAGWLVLAGALALSASRTGRRERLALATLSLAAAAREADWHSRFTTEPVVRVGYYLNAQVPVGQRLAAGLAVLLVLAIAAWALAHWLVWRRRATSSGSARQLIATAVALLLVTQVLDRAPAVWTGGRDCR